MSEVNTTDNEQSLFQLFLDVMNKNKQKIHDDDMEELIKRLGKICAHYVQYLGDFDDNTYVPMMINFIRSNVIIVRELRHLYDNYSSFISFEMIVRSIIGYPSLHINMIKEISAFLYNKHQDLMFVTACDEIISALDEALEKRTTSNE
jgi:hypothetical protein